MTAKVLVVISFLNILMKQRIISLLGELKKGVYEKDTELSLSLLAALAGQSILLLGPPGVAKSMVARRLKYAFQDARYVVHGRIIEL